MGDDTGKNGMNCQLIDVGLGALEHDLLAIALEFEDAHAGSVATVVGGDRLLEALDVNGSNGGFFLGPLEVDVGEDGPFLKLDLGFGEVGFSLAKIGNTLFGVGVVLRELLFHLMAEVLELGLGVAGVIDLLGGVEGGDQITFLDAGAVGDELGECHPIVLAVDLGDQNFGGVDGLDGAGDAHFAG
jgi:hypothetical protein